MNSNSLSPSPAAAALPRWRLPRLALSRWQWLAAGLSLVTLIPLAVILASFLHIDGEIWAHLSEFVLPRLLDNTALLLVGVGIGVLLLGVPLGWLVAVHEFPGRRLFSWALMLPLAAKGLAYALPPAVERQLGQGVLGFLDQHMFAPSQLDAARQQALRARFARLATPGDSAPEHRIVFRKSKIGPNAFALPSGDIVLTDEMVELLPDDEAIMGVLAHELRHLQQRHLTRRLIQTSAVGAGAALLFGDVSTVVATLPPLLLDLKYSRDVEREADDYAIAMLRQNGIALEHLAQVFVALGKLDQGTPYLSSHPASAERIERIRAAQR